MFSVIIVEDDLSIADLLQEALEQDHYSVIGIASSVEDGARLIEEAEPDFAVIDVRLANGRLGTDLGERLRRETKIRILYSTGNSDSLCLTTRQGHGVMMKPYLMQDVGRGLEIINETEELGHTSLKLPRGFRLLEAAMP